MESFSFFLLAIKPIALETVWRCIILRITVQGKSKCLCNDYRTEDTLDPEEDYAQTMIQPVIMMTWLITAIHINIKANTKFFIDTPVMIRTDLRYCAFPFLLST